MAAFFTGGFAGSASKYPELHKSLRELKRHTVCEEAKCPNNGARGAGSWGAAAA
jgi:lipoate synthase